MSGVVVLVSGGLDSITLVTEALAQGRHVVACHVDYGQPAREQEWRATRHWCVARLIPAVAITADGIFLAEMSAAPGAGPRVVPGRNAILVSLAMSVAVQTDCTMVWYGATADDLADYPDCRPVWIDAMSRVGELAYGVKLDAPFVGFTKAQVVERARALGVDIAETWSCYCPVGGAPCGVCNACRSRAWALGA